MQEDAVIRFDHVSKVYTLYRDSKAQFLALFFKPRKDSKNHKRHLALDDVNLVIRRGESVGVVGKNGAGKSTLLKMITGVAFPTTGEVTVNGRVSALLELTAGFSDDMTGRENIYLKGYILGLSNKEIREIEPKIEAFADLGDYMDQPVRTYSSGMKMRLGFAVNINTNPEILVIDEALSVGDAAFKKKCKDKIKELLAQDITVIFVSHSMESVQEVCNRAIYLKKGGIVFDGDVDRALEIYAADNPSKKKKTRA